MFTGIIQEVGEVKHARKIGGALRITVSAPGSARELNVHESVSLNGVCQTVVERTEGNFVVEAVEETLRKTTLGELREGSGVNVELPMRLNDRIGGHLVQGHVDGVGTVTSLKVLESSWLVTIEIPREHTRYVVPAGSIAVDGVSLTIASLDESHITVSLIPHTLENTTFNSLRVGSRVNLEFDLLGKYVERLMKGEQAEKASSSITPEKLAEWGYGG